MSESEAVEIMCRAIYGDSWGFLEASAQEDAYRALVAAGVIPQWREIESAPLNVPKGYIRAYSYKPNGGDNGRNYLRRTTNFECHYGARICDLYIDIPSPTQGEQA